MDASFSLNVCTWGDATRRNKRLAERKLFKLPAAIYEFRNKVPPHPSPATAAVAVEGIRPTS